MLLGILDGIGDIIGNIFQWLFNSILSPILEIVLGYLIEAIFTIIKYLFGYVFYIVSVFLLQLLDIVQSLFRALAGLGVGSENPPMTVTFNGQEGDLLVQLIRSKEVVNAFWSCCIVGIFLLIIMTIFQILKVEYTSEGAQNSKASIVGKSLKSLTNLLIIPVLVIFGIIIGNSVLGLIDTATGGGGGRRISGVMFVTAASGAAWESPGSAPGELKEVGDDVDLLMGKSIAYGIRAAFTPKDKRDNLMPPFGNYTTNAEDEFMKCADGCQYSHIGDVIMFYNVFEINYLVLIFGTCIILKCLFLTCFGLIDRVYQCLALFIISPFVIGMSPVKDSLGSWRTKFIQKALSAYGVVISLNLFFIIVELFLNMDIAIEFKNNLITLPTTTVAGLIKCVFVIVGCLMIEKLAGDLGQYFGGGNAMAEGKGLASEATKGIATAAKVGVGVAMGGAGIAAKLAKGGAGMVKGGVNLAKGVGTKFSESKLGMHMARKSLDRRQSRLDKKTDKFNGKVTSGFVNWQGQVTKNNEDVSAAEAGIATADDAIAEAKEKMRFAGTKEEYEAAKTELGVAKAAKKKHGDALKSAKKGRKELLKQRGMVKLQKKEDALGAIQDELDEDKAEVAGRGAARSARIAEKTAKRTDKRRERKQHTRDVVRTAWGGFKQIGRDGLTSMIPGPLSQIGKTWTGAVDKGSSYSEEGKAALERLKKGREDRAAAKYDKAFINRTISAADQNRQAQLISIAYSERLSADVANQNKLLQGIKDAIMESQKRINAAQGKDSKSQSIRQIETAKISNLIAQGQQISKSFDYDASAQTVVNAEINMDIDAFKVQLEEAVKRGAKMDEIKRIMAEEFKKAGLSGGNAEKMLAEFKKILEEIKGEIGK